MSRIDQKRRGNFRNSERIPRTQSYTELSDQEDNEISRLNQSCPKTGTRCRLDLSSLRTSSCGSTIRRKSYKSYNSLGDSGKKRQDRNKHEVSLTSSDSESESTPCRMTVGSSIHTPRPFTISIKTDPIELQEIIGRGGSGSIRRATFSGFSVAVKTINLLFIDQIAKDAIDREIGILMNTNHRNIMNCLGYRRDGERMMIFTQLYGRTLRQSIDDQRTDDNKPFKARQIKHFLTEIISGLAYLHDYLAIPGMDIQGPIIHRDLKSENIFVQEGTRDKPTLVIGDFGEAILLNGQTKLDKNIGTLEFMAPEMIAKSSSDTGQYDEKVDIYSFGMIIYELLSLDIPYQATKTPRNCLVKSIIKGHKPSIYDLKFDLDRAKYGDYFILYDECTQSEPNCRPSAAKIKRTLKA